MELRKWSYDYTSDLAQFANNKKIADNLRNIFPHPYTEENARQFIEFCLNTSEEEQANRGILYDNKAVGSISLTFGTDVYVKSAEIGYWVAEEYWGRGIATEAVKKMCHLAFEEYELARVFASVYSYNTGSCKVLEKCGFEMEGIQRRAIFKNGALFDSFMYGLIKC